jgi:hypothetical protein
MADSPTQGSRVFLYIAIGIAFLGTTALGLSMGGVFGHAPAPDDGNCHDEVHTISGSAYGTHRCTHPDHEGRLETRAVRSGCQTNDKQSLVCTCPPDLPDD